MNLTELADLHGSDKGTKVRHRHKYTYLYDLLFAPLKDEAITFVEIGLAIGGPENPGVSADRPIDSSPSVSMWLEYFSRAAVIGFDISDFAKLEGERFRFIRGDAGSEEDLRRLAASAPQFDVVIDDGSHASFHQQLALKFLWPKVSPGGLYIIEDLQWQSLVYEQTLPAVPKTAAFLAAYFEKATYLENTIFSAHDMAALKNSAFSSALFPSFQTAKERNRFRMTRLFRRRESPAARPWDIKLFVLRKKI